MIRYIFFFLFLFGSKVKASNKLNVFLKDGSILSSEINSNEKKILSNNVISINGKELDNSKIDSIKIDKELYFVINYKNTNRIARVLFIGNVSGFKIKYNGEDVIILRENNSADFISLNDKNIRGIYSYLFKECTSKDSNILKDTKLKNYDIAVIKDVTQKLNCNKTNYKIYKFRKPIAIYLNAIGGFSIYKPIVKSNKDSRFGDSKTKANNTYIAGGSLMIDIDNKFQTEVRLIYSEAKNKFTSSKSYTSPISFISYSNGEIKMKSVDVDFLFKYRFLKSKISPTINSGISFIYRKLNQLNYYTTSSIAPNPSENQVLDLNTISIGFQIGTGVSYKPINRLNLFLDLGCKISKALYTQESISISELNFYSCLGIGIKLNK